MKLSKSSHMKVFAVFLTFLVVGIAEKGTPIRKNGENGWFILQRKNQIKWSPKPAALSFLRAQDVDKTLENNKVMFYLYTKLNPGKGQRIEPTKESMAQSKFDRKVETRIVIHGCNQNHEDQKIYRVASAWLSRGEYNVIIVNWGSGRLVYIPSAAAAPAMGKKIAEMINFLSKDYGLKLQNLTVIGYSLGAHIAGFAGKFVEGGRIRTIVGLDPSFALFNDVDENHRLSIKDALYVEIMHTNAGFLGIAEPIGHADFYPNGGLSQPECDHECAHQRSLEYYAEAVAKECFGSVRCPNYTEALRRKCGGVPGNVRMGAVSNDITPRGVFVVQVRMKKPYGKRCTKKNGAENVTNRLSR